MSAKKATDLTVRELEALLQERQRRVAEETVLRVVSAQIDLGEKAHEGADANWEAIPPSGSPELWRGDEQERRRFRSPAPEPLDRERGGPRRRQRRPVTRRDRVLLVLEGAALIGFLAVLGASYGRLRDLNRQARVVQSAALAQITRIATPFLVPTEHRPQLQSPTSSARTVTIPTVTSTAVMLRAAPTVRSASPTPRATVNATRTPTQQLPSDMIAADLFEASGPNQPTIGSPLEPSEGLGIADADAQESEIEERGEGRLLPDRLTIADIQVDAPVVAGDSWEDLKGGVGYHLAGGVPGQPGNLILSAHNDIYGEIFRYLNRLEPGAEVQVQADGRVFLYQVQDVAIVLPNRVDLLEPTEDATLTLITCYPYLIDTHRVVVRARFVPEDE